MSLPWRFHTVEDYVSDTIARLQQAPPSYQHLNIGKYFLCRTDELTHDHLERIVEAAIHNPHIDELTLSGLQLQAVDTADSSTCDGALLRLAQLVQSRTWKRVTLTACGGTVVSAALDKAPRIRELRLTRCSSLSGSTMSALTSTLMVPSAGVRHLVLQDTDLSAAATSEDFLPLAEGIGATSSLETLEINYCTVNDIFIRTLATKGLAKNKSLVALHVPGCELEDDAVTMVVDGVSRHPTLKTLRLFRNHCGERGVVALAKLLLPPTSEKSSLVPATFVQLETLDLSYQQFERERKLNVELLAKSLAQNKTLKSLSLAFNKLNDADAVLLGEGLREIDSLEEIDLRANNIRDAGAVALADNVLRRAVKLRKFCLYGNPLGKVGAHSLLSAIQDNAEVEIINMDYGLPDYDKIHYFAYLNQAGRRLMKHEDFNLALWTVVIERARRISQESRGVCSAAELIYPFIRESNILHRLVDSHGHR